MAKFEIRQTVDKGRAAFATEDIPSGAVILEEKPFVSAQFSWNTACKYRACEYCLKPLETVDENVARLTKGIHLEMGNPEFCPVLPTLDQHVTCPHCEIQYCSANCRNDAAQRYHMELCLGSRRDDPEHPINVVLEAWKKVHYPPETTSIMLLLKVVAMYRQSNDRPAFLAQLKDFESALVTDNGLPHKMLGDKFEEHLRKLYPLYSKAFTQSPTTNEAVDMSMFLTPAAFHGLFGIFGRNGQGIGTSPFSVWVKKAEALNDLLILDLIDTVYQRMEKAVGLDFLNTEGAALYTMQSKFNHDCDPSATVTFPHSDHTMVMTANRAIRSGEEICISYLDECDLKRSRQSRQTELLENYLFACKCELCETQLRDPTQDFDSNYDSDEDHEEYEGDEEMES